MAIIGYARTSTLEQEAGFEAQLRELEVLGCDRVYKEQVSSVEKRPELDKALDYLRDGDTLVVTKLDRLARSVKHLGEILDHIKEKEAALRILDLGLDTSSATSQLILIIMGAVAQFERQMMLERQREGIAKAKAEGKYKGRKPLSQETKEEVLRLLAEGVGATEVSKKVGVGRSTVYEIKNEASKG
uniref:Putative resolvase n=1 Tax=Magnetococcus massalia (strain MO-1) TaxID=451514 RepID=A0A1S7LN25_MAGMO|nr:putative resolvase [Candidatus Magnetococcus massalia]